MLSLEKGDQGKTDSCPHNFLREKIKIDVLKLQGPDFCVT